MRACELDFCEAIDSCTLTTLLFLFERLQKKERRMEKCNSNSSKRNRNRMVLERGVVGLGIVAAMSVSNINNSTDVVSSAKAAANFRGSRSYGLFHASPLNTGTPYFLNSCNLCHKHLHGVDIFIYRF